MTTVTARHPGVLSLRRKNFLAATLLASTPAVLTAATYYASPSGSDSNPGTQSQPFRTVSRGITAVNPGDTIILEDGTYPADTPWGGGSTNGWLLWINKSGVSGAPITLKAQHQGQAILDCGNQYNGPQTGCMGYIYLGDPGPGFWVFDGLVFQNTYDTALMMNSSSPAHDIVVQNCTFQRVGQHATSQSTGMNGVYAGNGHYNLTFTKNTFTQVGRTSGSSNYSHDHGLYLHASNVTITNNLFYGPITGWGVQTASGFSGLIANNTFAFSMWNNGGQLMLWDTAGGPVTLQNNIFYQPNGGFAINACGFSAPSCTVDHNMVTNGTIGGNDTCGGGNNACTAPTNTMYADPQFMNANSAPYNFYYQSGSPAIDAGVTLGQVPIDFQGTQRPQGKAYDIGAYEYIFSAGPVTTLPVAPNQR